MRHTPNLQGCSRCWQHAEPSRAPAPYRSHPCPTLGSPTGKERRLRRWQHGCSTQYAPEPPEPQASHLKTGARDARTVSFREVHMSTLTQLRARGQGSRGEGLGAALLQGEWGSPWLICPASRGRSTACLVALPRATGPDCPHNTAPGTEEVRPCFLNHGWHYWRGQRETAGETLLPASLDGLEPSNHQQSLGVIRACPRPVLCGSKDKYSRTQSPALRHESPLIEVAEAA